MADSSIFRKLAERREPQGWVHHVADAATGELHTTQLHQPVAPLSRAERLSRLGHPIEPTVFGAPTHRLDTPAYAGTPKNRGAQGSVAPVARHATCNSTAPRLLTSENHCKFSKLWSAAVWNSAEVGRRWYATAQNFGRPRVLQKSSIGINSVIQISTLPAQKSFFVIQHVK